MPWWALPIVVVGAVAFGVLPWLTTFYRTTDTQFQIRSGLLNKKTKTAPLDRVRSVDLEASLLHRIVGLSKVQIGTGVDDDRITLDSVTAEEAAGLRSFLLSRRTPPPAARARAGRCRPASTKPPRPAAYGRSTAGTTSACRDRLGLAPVRSVQPRPAGRPRRGSGCAVAVRRPAARGGHRRVRVDLGAPVRALPRHRRPGRRRTHRLGDGRGDRLHRPVVEHAADAGSRLAAPDRGPLHDPLDHRRGAARPRGPDAGARAAATGRRRRAVDAGHRRRLRRRDRDPAAVPAGRGPVRGRRRPGDRRADDGAAGRARPGSPAPLVDPPPVGRALPHRDPAGRDDLGRCPHVGARGRRAGARSPSRRWPPRRRTGTSATPRHPITWSSAAAS